MALVDSKQNILALPNSFEITNGGLLIPDTATENDLVTAYKYLDNVEGKAQVFKGQIWNRLQNEKGYGSGKEFAEMNDINYNLAKEYGKIVGQYQTGGAHPLLISDKITFTHLKAVAYDENRDVLLLWVENNNISVSALKKRAKALKAEVEALENAPEDECDVFSEDGVMIEFSQAGVHIINDDCIIGLSKLEDESVDLIATDPPYNMDKEDWDSYGSGEEFAEWCAQWMMECQRILKPGGSIYIFGINRMLSHLQRWLDENMVYRNWIVWDTIQGAGGGLWINRHEAILYYSKTNDTYEDGESVKLERHEENIREYKGKEYKFKNPSNIWRFPCVDNKHKDRTEHITQKPVEIMDRIIKASCPVGGLVCDPFSGSGTTAVSAYRNNRKFIGFEMDKVNYTESIKRVNSEIQV